MVSAPSARPTELQLQLLAILSSLAAFALLQAVAFLHAGVFEYPLDDVYIHLAMARRLADGTYGVNAGEAASASSSILYTALLLPFAHSDLQRYMPLLWNLVAVVAIGAGIGRAVHLSRLGGAVAVGLALALPICLNVQGVAFTGMENALQAAVALFLVLGLWAFLDEGRLGKGLVLPVILLPLLRYEGLALSLLAVWQVWRTPALRPRAYGLALAVLAPVLLFSVFLLSLGLDALPNSVLAKQMSTHGHYEFLYTLGRNLTDAAGLLTLASMIYLAIFTYLPPRVPGQGPWLAVVLVAAGLAHLCFARFGWMFRYEHYLILGLAAGMLLLARHRRKAGLAGVVAMAIASLCITQPKVWASYAWNPFAIHRQQGQMARFTADVLKAPVAVNDLGYVAWRSPSYVLDLWGLGQAEVRRLRYGAAPPPDAWAEPLLRAHDVQVVMAYPDWISRGLGARWQVVATLVFTAEQGGGADAKLPFKIGGHEVAFYAGSPQAADTLRAQLQAFAPSLPAGVELKFSPSSGETDGG